MSQISRAAGRMTRRAVLGGLVASPLLTAGPGWGQGGAQGAAAPMALPLTATRLEHMGAVVPDVAAAARFHSALFNPALHTEQQPDPLRLYVDLNGGYLAFGGRAGVQDAFFDHFCALIADYDSAGMQAALRARGVEPAANFDTFGLMQDPDGIGVQLVADPGGWFPTVIEAAPLVGGPPLVTPAGLTHVVLRVSDLSASADYYGAFFAGARSDGPGRLVVPMGPTELEIVEAETPGIARIGVAVAPFDHGQLGEEVRQMGGMAETMPTPRGIVLRVTDPFGLSLDLVPRAG